MLMSVVGSLNDLEMVIASRGLQRSVSELEFRGQIRTLLANPD